MNAVDAAEDLLKIGRQLQAIERTLCLSPALAGPPSGWQALFADPTVRLEELLARHSTPSGTARVAGHQPPATPIDWPMATSPAAQSNDKQRDAGANLRQPQRQTPAAGTNLPYLGVAPSGQGIQLARDHTALQSIVNANLHSTSHSQPAVTNQDGDRHAQLQSAAGGQTGPAARQLRSGTYDAVVALSSGPGDMRNAGAHGDQTPEASPAHQRSAMSATGPSLRSLEPGAHASAQTPGVDLAHGAISADSNEVAPASIEGGAVAQWGHSAPIWPDDVNIGQPGTERAGPWHGAQPASSAPSQEEGGMIRTEHTVNTGLLHPVQVEQILDAFNERLELLLLRAYGP